MISSDSLTLAAVCIGSCNDTWHGITKRKKPLLELTFERGGDAFETTLEHAIEFALEQISEVGRDLGHNAPYQETNSRTLAYKFNVTKIELIRLVDDGVLQSEDD